MINEVNSHTTAAAQSQFTNDTSAIALNAAHAIAFHRGLGNSIYPSSGLSQFKVSAEEVEAYAAAAYVKPNIALVGSGLDSAEASKWVGEFFSDVSTNAPSTIPAIQSASSKYFGGEERIHHAGGNSVVIAFSGSGVLAGSAAKPEIDVIAALLGGQSSIKWSHGSSMLSKVSTSHPTVSISTESLKYSDAGLMAITLTGPAKAVTSAAKDTVAILKSVAAGDISSEAMKKAMAGAKFKAYDSETSAPLSFGTLGLNTLSGGKVKSSEESLQGISNVSEGNVKEVSRLHLPLIGTMTD